MDIVTREELSRFGDELVDRLTQQLGGGTAGRHLLRMEEAADRLGVSLSKTYELAQTGELPTVRIGRNRRVPSDLLAGYLDSLAIAGGGR